MGRNCPRAPCCKSAPMTWRTRYSIWDIAFSPDGRLIAAAEGNNPVPRVAIFEVRTGHQVKLLTPHDRPPGWVGCMAFSPDGTKLMWGEIGGDVALWDLTNDRCLFRENLHTNAVNQVAFSPDGRLMASVGEDGAVHLRSVGTPAEVVQDLATGERQPVLHRAYAGDIPSPLPVGPFSMAFTRDGSRLIVGQGSSASITIWRVRGGQLLRRIEKANGNYEGSRRPSVTSIAVTPDGRRIMSAGQRTVSIEQTMLKYGARNVRLSEVRFWDLETGEHVKDLHGEEDHGFGHAALCAMANMRRSAISACCGFSMSRRADSSSRSHCRAGGAVNPSFPPTGPSSPWRSTTPSPCLRYEPAGGCITTSGRLWAG